MTRRASRKSVSPSLQGGGAAETNPSGRAPVSLPSPADDRDERTRRREGKDLKIIRFAIPGPLLGYRASWTRHNRKYHEFKSNVLLLAMEAGFQNVGSANEISSPRLTVRIFWTRYPRIDWKNVYGGIEDALWYDDDRWVQPGDGSGFSCGNSEEYAEVEIHA